MEVFCHKDLLTDIREFEILEKFPDRNRQKRK